jgi:hypothetical protein
MAPFLVPYQINNQGISSLNVVFQIVHLLPIPLSSYKKAFLHLFYLINIDPFKSLKFCNLNFANKLQASIEFLRPHECLVSMELYKGSYQKSFDFLRKVSQEVSTD